MQRQLVHAILGSLVLIATLAPALGARVVAAPSFEASEFGSRAVVVTSQEDSGPGTLRAALLDARAGDVITFDPAIFSPTSPVTISLASSLPAIVANDLTIDASDAGVTLAPQISGSIGSGLIINGAHRTILRGLQVRRFVNNGIVLRRGASGAIIGGDRSIGAGPLGQGNLISGNNSAGVRISDPETSGNHLLGNHIGVDISGLDGAGYQAMGILIETGANNNWIGGSSPATRNLIGGNSAGVVVEGTTTGNNRIAGNDIGVDALCADSLGNYLGVNIAGAGNNIIGGEDPADRNVISGNRAQGVLIEGEGASSNRVLGNYIGTNCDGTGALGNAAEGVVVGNGAAANTIGGASVLARNIISGNESAGVSIANATGNRILGNLIGSDVSGVQAVANQGAGVRFDRGAKLNVVGGSAPEERNLISGNLETGVMIVDAGSMENRIIGNYIGADTTGTHALANRGGGVLIAGGASRNEIGGADERQRNLISGNIGFGVRLQGGGTTENQVIGNFIGADTSGLSALGNSGAGVELGPGATGNQIGGTMPGQGNVISGNARQGVYIAGSGSTGGATGNQIVGNIIGADQSRLAQLPNAIGVEIDSFLASANVIRDSLIAFNANAGIVIKNGAGNVFQNNDVRSQPAHRQSLC